jgi:outer membrane lipoprotein SlyB
MRRVRGNRHGGRVITRTTQSLIMGLACALVAACSTSSMRVGHKATVQFGVVGNAENATLDSNAAEGALVGGMLGLTASGGSRGMRNAVIGAAGGGAAAGAAPGSRPGMRYTVELLDGSSARIVTDQTEIRVGDCVAIERVRDTANIRRAPANLCDPANRAVVASAESPARADATACERAKRELADAATSSELDLATRKIELLCNG